MQKNVFLIFALLACSIAEAEEEPCDESTYAIIGKKLKLNEFTNSNDGGIVVDSTCKIWTYNKNITIAAFGYTPSESTEEDPKKNIIVALIDNNRRFVISSSLRTIQEDAITEVGSGSLKLDTGRYQLSENTRAIGLRFYCVARGPSCGEASWNNELTLYSPEANILRPVLQIYMSQQRAFSGCIGAATGNDSGEYTELSIAIDRTRSHGFNDLKILANIELYFSTETPSGTASSKKQTESYVMKYNGSSYTNSDKNPPWWMGYY
ncbi:MAG: PA3715 family protein [Methylobacter sp.]